MKATYSAEIDASRSLLKLRLSGFFSIEDVRRLAAIRNAALRDLNCARNQHITLCDARGGMLSTPEVALEFKRLVADPRYASRRLAYVADGALAKMQVNRVLQRVTAFFDNVEDAEHWLFADEMKDVA